MSEEALRTESISKSFGRVTALRDVSIRLNKGEVLGLLGDNGAGKSPLMKILTGFHKPTTGKIFFEGQEIELKSVSHARSLGIEPVYQDLALINEVNVYRNMFLQKELMRNKFFQILDDREMRRLAQEHLKQMRVNIPSVDVEISKLSGGQRQAIAVARAVSSNARILLLDEPLAAMGAREARLIIELIDRLKARGDIAIVMIAHNYAQTLEICDRVILVQHGEITFESHTAATSAEELLEIVRREYRAVRTG